MSLLPLGLEISILKREFGKRLEVEAAKLNLTDVQLIALSEISSLEKTKEKVIEKDLQESMNLSHPTVVKIVEKLVAKGFIECKRDPVDGRRSLLRVYPEYRDINQKLAVMDNEVFDNLASNLTAEEKETFINTLERILANAR